MASENPLRSARLPSQQQVIELLEAEFARAGYDVEDVVVDASRAPPRIVVIADGDGGLDLDALGDAVAVGLRTAGPARRFARRSRLPPGGHLAGRGPAADRRAALPPRPGTQGRGDADRRLAGDGPARRGGGRRRATGRRRPPHGRRRFANFPSTTSPMPLSRWNSHHRTRSSSSWPGCLARRVKSEHRHGCAACHRSGPGDLGRRTARDHQVRAADRLPAHRRATKPRPASTSTARAASSRCSPGRPTTTAT